MAAAALTLVGGGGGRLLVPEGTTALGCVGWAVVMVLLAPVQAVV